MNHHEQSRLGHEAQAALPVVDAAFDIAIKSISDKLLSMEFGDKDALFAVHAQLKGLELAKQAVRQVIATGQLADAAIVASTQS